MALYGIGNTKVEIIIRHNQNMTAYHLVVKDGITLTRTPNEPSVLTFEAKRDHISVEYGDYVQLIIDDDHQQFAGYVESITYKQGWTSVTAYDHLWFLQKNTASKFAYENMTANEIYLKIIRENHLPITDPPQIMGASYVIPARIEDNTHYLDIITTALRLTKENTGEILYIWDDFGNLCMHTEEWLAEQPKVRISAGYIEDYDFTIDGSDFYTASKVVNTATEQQNTTTATQTQKLSEPIPVTVSEEELTPIEYLIQTYADKKDDSEKTEEEKRQEEEEKKRKEQEKAIEKREKELAEIRQAYDIHYYYNLENIPKYGYREAVGTFNAGENGDQKAQKLLEEHQNFTRTINIKGCQGDVRVRGGTPMLIDFFTHDKLEYIRGWFRTDSVTHNFNGGYHTMDLQMTQIRWIDDWENPEPNFGFNATENQVAEENRHLLEEIARRKGLLEDENQQEEPPQEETIPPSIGDDPAHREETDPENPDTDIDDPAIKEVKISPPPVYSDGIKYSRK